MVGKYGKDYSKKNIIITQNCIRIPNTDMIKNITPRISTFQTGFAIRTLPLTSWYRDTSTPVYK